MTDPLAGFDYRTLTDAELDSCSQQIEAVRQGRRLIATEDAFAAIHEQAASDSLAAAQRIRADAAAARLRQGRPSDTQEEN